MIELLLFLILLTLLAICYKLSHPGKTCRNLSFRIERKDLSFSKRGGENRPLKY